MNDNDINFRIDFVANKTQFTVSTFAPDNLISVNIDGQLKTGVEVFTAGQLRHIAKKFWQAADLLELQP